MLLEIFFFLLFRWRSIEGDSALCECCNTDCSGLAGVKNHGHPETGYWTLYKIIHQKLYYLCNREIPFQTAGSVDFLTDEKFEARRTAGPLHVVHQAYWTGELSVSWKKLLQIQSLVGFGKTLFFLLKTSSGRILSAAKRLNHLYKYKVSTSGISFHLSKPVKL